MFGVIDDSVTHNVDRLSSEFPGARIDVFNRQIVKFCERVSSKGKASCGSGLLDHFFYGFKLKKAVPRFEVGLLLWRVK